jgi:GNAT superfamily N-acetyltransferase
MRLPDDLGMRTADEHDVPAIASLRESVGWAAHEWALRAVLDPSDSRCLLVIDGDRVVGVGSGISYGSLGFVGNMVVAEGYRRRGIGAAILEAVIGFLEEERGCERLELFATESGRPLYARYGFALTDPSAMASVPRSTTLSTDRWIEIDEARDADGLADYDAPRFGGNRRRLLAMMARDPGRPLLVAREGGTIIGYAWLRSDGPRLGPVLADTPGAAAALLAAAFARVPAASELTLNVPTANEPGMEWLASLGIGLEPWDGRMARGSAASRRDETIYANLVGALG